jgi:anti-sigma regulatory factor (Ser/Thr protein kinase)
MMMADCMLTMEFEAHFKNVDIARAALQGISAECFGKDSGRAADITIAASEAMNNAVEHSRSTTVSLEVAWNGNELRVCVISGGLPFDPVAQAASLSREDMLERDEGGYGIYLIRELVDSFEYEYRDSRNIWKLYKLTGL